MAINHTPETGAWYINMNNQFLRIWGVIYEHGVAEKLVLHYLNGSRSIVTLCQWAEMDLIRYPEESTQQTGTTPG